MKSTTKKHFETIKSFHSSVCKFPGKKSCVKIIPLKNSQRISESNRNNFQFRKEDIYIRLSQEDDTFLPFGGDAEESMDSGEVVYAVGHQVRTRRWTWRQSEHGKITSASTDIFFPIDGFTDFNREQVLAARNELEAALQHIFNCETKVGFVDMNHSEMEL